MCALAAVNQGSGAGTSQRRQHPEDAAWTTIDVGAPYRTTLANTPAILRANITNLANANYWIANPTRYGSQSALDWLEIRLQRDPDHARQRV